VRALEGESARLSHSFGGTFRAASDETAGFQALHVSLVYEELPPAAQ